MWEIYRTHERKTKQQHVVKTHTHTHFQKVNKLAPVRFPVNSYAAADFTFRFFPYSNFFLHQPMAVLCVRVCVCVLSLSLSLSLSREKQPSEERTLAPLKAQVYNIFFVIYVTSLVFHVT